MSRKDSNKLVKVDPKDLTDPVELLDLLKDAILNKTYDRDKVATALRQLLSQYEAKNRVFMIAAANAELPRIIRLLTFLNNAETEMFQEHRVKNASMRELIKLYALAQSTLVTGIDNVKKVADMRLEIMRAGGSDGLSGIFNNESDDIDVLSNLPGLDSYGRDKVRKVIQGLVESIGEDEDEEDAESDD